MPRLHQGPVQELGPCIVIIIVVIEEIRQAEFPDIDGDPGGGHRAFDLVEIIAYRCIMAISDGEVLLVEHPGYEEGRSRVAYPVYFPVRKTGYTMRSG